MSDNAIKISTIDEQMHKIYSIIKLSAAEKQLDKNNLHAFVIKTMRLVDKIKKISGMQKREIATNIILTILKDFQSCDVVITTGDVEQIIQSLYDVGVLVKKSGCC